MNIRCEISGGLYGAVAGLSQFPILLCVGSDKITGDALAPVCGELLKRMNPPCFIYGDLQSPVNAKNLSATLKFIKALHPGRKILVVDASIGSESDIGKIKFLPCGIKPGKAVGKDFAVTGDLAIAGIVSFKEYKGDSFAPVRLFDVVEMAKEISREIYLCARSYHAMKKGMAPRCEDINPLAGVCP